jgi:hypothetical protein
MHIKDIQPTEHGWVIYLTRNGETGPMLNVGRMDDDPVACLMRRLETEAARQWTIATAPQGLVPVYSRRPDPIGELEPRRPNANDEAIALYASMGGVVLDSDTEFTDYPIESWSKTDKGYDLNIDGGTLHVTPEDFTPAEPLTSVRIYGNARTMQIRGLMLDGKLVHYRTPGEYRQDSLNAKYAATGAEWLERWDRGEVVYSVKMAGMYGPAVEQIIQITAAENLRVMVNRKMDVAFWANRDAWEEDRKIVFDASITNPRIAGLGLGGNQFSAALSLAVALYKDGPVVAVGTQTQERQIMVSSTFPTVV